MKNEGNTYTALFLIILGHFTTVCALRSSHLWCLHGEPRAPLPSCTLGDQHWQLEVGPRGSIYTTEIGKCYKLAPFLPESWLLNTESAALEKLNGRGRCGARESMRSGCWGHWETMWQTWRKRDCNFRQNCVQSSAHLTFLGLICISLKRD